MSNTPYDDIINLPRPVSQNHRPMPREARAAQFAPFAALTGYDDCVKEEARLTGERIELTDEQVDRLNLKTAYLTEKMKENPPVKVTYFLPDGKKDGGMYVTAEGEFSRIEETEGFFIFSDKRKIPLFEIIEIESEIFKDCPIEGI